MDDATAFERFIPKVVWNGDEEGCWTWEGYRLPNGYGRFFFQGKVGYSHRFAYLFFVGPVLDGLELDHLCRNPACCNPDHLEPVTHQENVRRGAVGEGKSARPKKTHCHKGHPMSDPNLGRKRKTQERYCMTCDRERQKAYYWRRKRREAADS